MAEDLLTEGWGRGVQLVRYYDKELGCGIILKRADIGYRI